MKSYLVAVIALKFFVKPNLNYNVINFFVTHLLQKGSCIVETSQI